MKRKTLSIVACLSVLCLAVGFAACQNGDGDVVADVLTYDETMLAVKVTELDGKATLLDVMENLQEDGEIEFEISGTMIVSINGVTNDADYDPCWMLYTTDAEMANAEWGVVEYGGETLGSAVLGAEALLVKEDEIYVWSYHSF